jgi:tRNA threonylcarbamoyladenosine modification (KEOPS) complex  Pcc1 subunit
VYGFVGNATTRLQGELTILILKNCKARVKISLKSPLNEYGALLKSIYVAINADTKIPTPGAASNKSTVNISMLDSGSNHNCNLGSGCLLLELHGTDISALRAVLNSYLWLIDASINAYSASITASS